jgi:hypothetical protein
MDLPDTIDQPTQGGVTKKLPKLHMLAPGRAAPAQGLDGLLGPATLEFAGHLLATCREKPTAFGLVLAVLKHMC